MIDVHGRRVRRGLTIAVAVFLCAVSPLQADAQTSATETQLLSSPNPSTVGQKVTFTANVDGLGGGAPNGKVTFRDGGAELGKVRLQFIGTGQAMLAQEILHACAVTDTGGVRCWGNNPNGQLGNGTTKKSNVPVNVTGLSSGAVAVTAGANHSCALMRTGQVKCWGSNGDGQLGDGTRTDRHVPVDVTGLSDVIAIAAGYDHTCALTRAQRVFCWGADGFDALGDGGASGVYSAVPVSSGPGTYVALTAGAYHTCAIAGDARVECWGSNYFGQLGLGTTGYTGRGFAEDLTNVVAVAGGEFHTCALKADGTVACWGNNQDGQLGDGSKTNRSAPQLVQGLAPATAVVAGEFHTCTASRAGGAECWGENGAGQLGDGTRIQRLSPVSVAGLSGGVVAMSTGGFSSCALNSTGGLVCWGGNAVGELGDGSNTRSSTPVQTKHFTGLVRTRAKFAISTLGSGTHTLTAKFPGDALHSGSSATLSQTVN
jgi:alpha-tubulin suppressor-like RCC1 family protein